jgi:putative ABC transport system ATP-binding protein
MDAVPGGAMADEAVLRLEAVRKSYPSRDGGALEVLRIPRWEVPAGAEWALVGPSGSGKTTLLHLLAGLRTPDEGTVTVRGTSLGSLSEAARDRFRGAHIGMIFQGLNLLQGLTARENILASTLLAGRRGRDDGARADRLLERVGLASRARHLPAELSLGEQQRVAIARALLPRPALLLADEPTGSLDPSRRDAVVTLLREAAREEGATLLVVTHDAAVAAALPRTVALSDLAAGAAA